MIAKEEVFSVDVEGEYSATRANSWKGAQESGIKGWIPLRYWREVLWDSIISWCSNVVAADD